MNHSRAELPDPTFDRGDSRSPIVIAGMWQETNTYSSRHTTLADYQEFEYAGPEHIRELHSQSRSVIGGFLNVLGDRARPAFSAAAWPAGLTPVAVFESLMSRLDDELRAAGPAAGVLLNLHGAMVAEGHPDVEREVVDLVKRAVGDVPIVAVLDFHANPSAEFLRSIDAVVSYNTYPHVDMFERGVEAAHCLVDIIEEDRRWSVTAQKLPLLTSPLTQGSADQPVAQIMRRRAELLRPRTLIAAMPGFVYSDVARAGFTVAVSAPTDAHTVGTDELSALAWSLRDQFAPSVLDVSTGVQLARQSAGTTVLADIGDNIGGGSTGEGTDVLRELMRTDDGTPALVVICDATAAAEAHTAGAGATLDIRFGGRLDDMHGGTVRARVTVVSLSSGRYVASGAWMGGHTFEMGPTAVLRIRDLWVIVTSVATPPFHREQITSQGLDPASFGIVAAKGALAWQDGLSDIAPGAFFVDTAGSTPARPSVLERTRASETGQPWTFPRLG